MNAEENEATVSTRSMTHTICRACHAQCSLLMEMEDGRPIRIYGDKNNPMSKGFSCVKGRSQVAYHESPNRLRTSVKRSGDSFEPIHSDQAMREIAEKLQSIIDEHGPRSIALYCGTFGLVNTLSHAFLQLFMESIGSKMLFTTATIDQPGKILAYMLHGPWLAGWWRDPDDLDVALVVGQNPIISFGGAFGFSPAHNIVETRKKGLKLIVCDPRKTETAKYADIFLQPKPGEDATIMAGLVRVVLQEQLGDEAFVAAETTGLEALRTAVAPFTPEFVESRAGIAAEQLVAAARMYAAGKKGQIICGTGTNMSPHGTLAEYLALILMTLCGHWPRAAEPVRNSGVLYHRPAPSMAATPGPLPAWGLGEKLRVHNLTQTAAGLPTAALADEILTPGEGQIKALIVVGGNPMLAFPDQQKVFKAMKSLDLLVCIDPQISATGRLAHYVIAPTLPLEVPAVTSFNEFLGTWSMAWGYEEPYAQYTPAILPRPANSDLIDEWEFFLSVARHMGLPLSLKPACYTNPQEAVAHAKPLDPNREYSTDEMLAMLFDGAPVPYGEIVEKGRAGHVFDVPQQVVQAKPDGWAGRFELANAVMLKELNELSTPKVDECNEHFPFMLISRRLRDFYNTSWHGIDALRRENTSNPAFMNPTDMASLALSAGDIVEITSDTGTIYGVVSAEAGVRQGCISMSHGWGVNPDEAEDPRQLGGCTSRLQSTDRDCDPYSWMPRQSTIPVRLRKAEAEAFASPNAEVA